MWEHELDLRVKQKLLHNDNEIINQTIRKYRLFCLLLQLWPKCNLVARCMSSYSWCTLRGCLYFETYHPARSIQSCTPHGPASFVLYTNHISTLNHHLSLIVWLVRLVYAWWMRLAKFARGFCVFSNYLNLEGIGKLLGIPNTRSCHQNWISAKDNVPTTWSPVGTVCRRIYS